MRTLALGLLITLAATAQTRWARLGELEGKADAQLHPASAWTAAVRNTPLTQNTRLATGAASRLEVELDDGSVLRLAADSQAELADYTRLSTGQRITHVALDRGVAYFAGAPEWRDALVVSLPGAQVALKRGSRVRLETGDGITQIAVIEGEIRFSSPAIEVDIRESKMVRLDLAHPDRFSLLDEMTSLESDSWSRERDKLLSGGVSQYHLPWARFGRRDLDGAGSWIDTAELGAVWKPKVADGWIPFRDGKWLWQDGLGYTWIANESWGWLPFHYGRWTQQPSLGWVWAPGAGGAFKPGDVYWMRGASLVGWGPLAPGESWSGLSAPALYLSANTTFAKWNGEAREIDPEGFIARPKDPLAATAFAAVLPSPPMLRERLEWVRAPFREGTIRLTPTPPPPPPVQQSRAPDPSTRRQPPPPPRSVERPMVVSVPLPPPIQETYYLAPIYTGIIVMNPPEREQPRRPRKSNEAEKPKQPDEVADQAPVADELPPVDRDAPLTRAQEGGRRSR